MEGRAQVHSPTLQHLSGHRRRTAAEETLQEDGQDSSEGEGAVLLREVSVLSMNDDKWIDRYFNIIIDKFSNIQ